LSINNVDILDQERKNRAYVTSQLPRAVEVAYSNTERIATYCQFYLLWLLQPSTWQSLHQLRADRITRELLPNVLSANLFRRVA